MEQRLFSGGFISLKRILAVGIFVAVLVAFLLLSNALGVRALSMLSGSMEPEIPTGSLLLVCSVDASSLQVGDVVAYSPSQETVVTHRIVEVLDSPLSFRTKGDANSFIDPTAISAEKIQGKVMLYIPFLGYVSVLLKTPVGIIALASIAIPWLLAALLPQVLLGKGVRSSREMQ